MRAREDRQPDGVGVLLDDGLDDLLGGLVQPSVDDLHARVAQGARDDLRAAIMAVEAWLGDDDADLLLDGGVIGMARPRMREDARTAIVCEVPIRWRHGHSESSTLQLLAQPRVVAV